jgi:hypothetical protein
MQCTGSLEDFTRDDTYNTYCVVGEAYRGLRRGLSNDERKHSDEWFFRIFGRHAGPKWMADSPRLFKDDCFLSSFSPTRVRRLAQLGSEIDFGGFAKAFKAKCPKDVLQELGENAEMMGRAEGAFKGAFLQYVRGWVRFLTHVSAQGKGFLVYEG